MRNHITVCILSLFLQSCVSVQLPASKVASAKNVELEAPPRPFKEIAAKSPDKSWISDSTGNTISYLSECDLKVESSLEQIENETVATLNNLSLLSAESPEYNGRAARFSTYSGTLDGVPVQLSLVIFKKNGCNFILSYGGVSSKFNAEESYFKNFINSFKAP